MPDISLSIESTPVGDFAKGKLMSGLKSSGSLLSGAAEGLQAGAEASVDEVTALLENTMRQILDKGMDAAMGVLGIDPSALETAQTIVNSAQSVVSGVSSIISILPTGVSTVPSTKNPMSLLASSLKEIAMEQLNSMTQIYNEGKNAVMSIADNYEEILLDAMLVIIDKIIELCDAECYRWTGYHIIEIYYAGRKGFQLMRELFRKKGEGGDQFEDSGEERSLSVDKEALRQQMLDWLAEQSDALYNAFLMLSFKDMVMDLKENFARLTNADVALLAESIENLDSFIAFLEEIGISEDGCYMTIEDIMSQGLNAVMSAANALNSAAGDAMSLADPHAAADAAMMVQANTTVTRTETYRMSSDVADGRTVVSITLRTDPRGDVRTAVGKTLEKVTNDDGGRMFDTATVMTVLDHMQAVYDGAEDGATPLTVLGRKSGAMLAPFDFVVEVDETPGAEPEPHEADVDLGGIEVEEDDGVDEKRRNTFDILRVLVTALKPVTPVLREIAHLVSNYKTNKAKVREHAHADAAIAMLKVMDRLGMRGRVDTKSSNFYTIRTRGLLDAAMDIGPGVGADGMMRLDREGTVRLVRVVKSLGLDASGIDPDKPTVAYVDMLSVEHPELGRTDGSLDRLGNVNPVPDMDTVQYTEDGRSVYASQIMQAISLGLDWTR